MGSVDQLWAIFYRGVVWEYHSKELIVRRYRELMSLLREAGKSTGEDWENLSAIHAGTLQGLKDGTEYLRWLHTEGGGAQSDELEGWMGIYSGPRVIAGTGAFNPEETESGRRIQRSPVPGFGLKCLAHSIIVEANFTKIVFVWRKKDLSIRTFVESLVNLIGGSEQRGWPNWFFLHCENIYFNAQWWANLPGAAQRHVEKMALNGIDHGFVPDRWRGRPVDDWRLREGRWS